MTSFGRVISVRGSLARVGLLAASQMPVSEVRATVGRFISIRCASFHHRRHDHRGVLRGPAEFRHLYRHRLGRPARRNPRRRAAQIPARRHQLSDDRRCRRPDHQSGTAHRLRAERLRPDQCRHAAAGPLGRSPMSMSRKCSPSISRCSAPPASANRAACRCCSTKSSRARPNLRIFLLDVHNEYGRCFGDRALVLNPRNLKLPFWLFNFEEIVDVLFGGRPGVPEELDILAEVIPMAKGIYTQYQNSDRVGLEARRSQGDRLHRRYAGALSAGRPDLADRRAHGQAREPLLAHHLSQADLAHRDRAQRSALRLHVRQRQCRRRHHGGSDQPSVPPAGQRQADDHHAARRLPGRSRRFRGLGAVPHGVRFRPVERRRRRRCCSSARRRIATPRPTATSASGRPARRSRASPRKAANTASFSASSRSVRPSSTPPSSPSATRCSRCAWPTSATRRCCARRCRTPPRTCCRSCPRSAPARCWPSAKAWRCRRGCASRKFRSTSCRAAKPPSRPCRRSPPATTCISSPPCWTAGAARPRIATCPTIPAIGDRPAARIMTPVEAPMLQPSMGLDPDRFSLLKKPLR